MVTHSVSKEIYDGWKAEKPIANGGIVLINQNKEVLLLERGFGANKGLWEFSGGSLEKSESPEEGALRELEEETGIKLTSSVKEIGTFRAVSPDKTDICTIFLANVTTPIDIIIAEEHSAFKWVDLQDTEEVPMHSMMREILDVLRSPNGGLLINKCPRVTILVPCLNEIEGLPKILPRIKKEWYDQMIILDAWSTDGSREWCEENGYTVLLRSHTGAGIWEAYTEVFASGMVEGDIIITFSPDGNSIPEVIPELVDKVNEGYDMVIASRYLGGHTSPDDTWLTKIGNKVLTGVCNLLSWYKYTDGLVMYRAYRREIIEQLRFDAKPNLLQRKLIRTSPLYSYEPSLAVRSARAGLRISEIYAEEPPAYRERRQNTFVHGFVLLTQILMERLWKPRAGY